jgi:hypothetical protein
VFVTEENNAFTKKLSSSINKNGKISVLQRKKFGRIDSSRIRIFFFRVISRLEWCSPKITPKKFWNQICYKLGPS